MPPPAKRTSQPSAEDDDLLAVAALLLQLRRDLVGQRAVEPRREVQPDLRNAVLLVQVLNLLHDGPDHLGQDLVGIDAAVLAVVEHLLRRRTVAGKEGLDVRVGQVGFADRGIEHDGDAPTGS
jgi:hypothetical protein